MRDCDWAGPAVDTNDSDYIEWVLRQDCRHDLASTLSGVFQYKLKLLQRTQWRQVELHQPSLAQRECLK